MNRCRWNGLHSIEIARGARQLAPWVSEYLRLVQRIDAENAPDLSVIDLPEDPLVMLYLAASILQVPAAEKQHLLEVTYASELLAHVVTALPARGSRAAPSSWPREKARARSWPG